MTGSIVKFVIRSGTMSYNAYGKMDGRKKMQKDESKNREILVLPP
jgi:hypothetical protein